jgi:hypothetical protein
VRATLRLAVRQLGRDDQLPGVALDHQLHGLGPALDDLVRGEGGGGAALVRRVEFGAVDQSAGVVALARGADLRVRLAVARLDDLVLQTRGQSDDAVLGGVGGQVRLAGLRGGGDGAD